MSVAIIMLFLFIYIDQHGDSLNILDIMLLSTAVYIIIGLILICRKEK